MTEEAMQIWKEACEAGDSAYYAAGEQPNDPEGVKQNAISHKAAAAVIAEALAARDARIAELEAELRAAKEAHWFYYGDDCSSDACRMSINECIDEDFEWDNKPEGEHVLQISGARPVPDMWVALRYFTEEEKDARQDDEPYSYTVHATEEEALAALETKHG